MTINNHEIFLLRQFIEGEIKPFKEENAKLTRLLAEACDEIFLLSNMHLTHPLENCSEELQQWYEEHKKEHQNES